MGRIVTLNGRPHDLDYEPSVAHGSSPMRRAPVIINGRMVHGVDINGYDYPPADSGSVLYMPGLPGYGSTIWDRAPHSNHGTITGATWVRLPSGVYVLSFDGDDYINIDTVVADLATNTAGTLAGWFKVTDATPATIQRLLHFGDTNANERLSLAIRSHDGFLSCDCIDANVTKWTLVSNAAVASNDTFVHLALTHNGTAPVIYVNGVAVAQTFTDSTDKTVWFSALTGIDNGRIGCSNYNNSGNVSFLTGSVGIIQICNRALSASEVQSYFQQTRHLFRV